jgi:hemerythrin-like domain-containing protein
MKKERYNLFERVHKTLTRMVFDTGMKIQHTEFACQKESFPVIDRMEDSIRFFRYHIMHEDSVIYDSIVHAAPYIVATMELTNAKDLKLTHMINEKLDDYENLCMNKSYAGFGAEIRTLYFSFTSAVLQHIHNENHVITDILNSLYDDGGLAQMEMNLVRQMLATGNNWYLSQVLAWLTDDEIVSWLNWISTFTNTTDTGELLETARPSIPAERWLMLSEILSVQRA